eukprot:TRINITY_DN4042_c0_g1_i1.p1 TRINITY_DN4042_c0_g1~~TRINITY_DN4042_c0_g1_i1.p1  ORF type:complete len:251 (+),score=34.30 TRINITY_DN4042_c0_g1_i1:61-813(+)
MYQALSAQNCTFQWVVDYNTNFVIADPILIIWSILAIGIGIEGYFKFKKSKQCLYSIIFLMYGTMMTVACLCDSVLVNQISRFFEDSLKLVDVSLTSSIALMFLYAGLVDNGNIDISKKSTKCRVVLSFIILWVLWIVTFFCVKNPVTYLWADRILYYGVISICCLLFLILEISYVNDHQHKGNPFTFLVCSGVFGGIGICGQYFTPLICKIFGNSFFINGPSAWFLCSDIAMILIYKFVVSSHALTTTK